VKAVLFCVNPYAFGILNPLYEELVAQGHQVLWYVHAKMHGKFPLDDHAAKTHRIDDVSAFKADAIFVPGNEVPHYLRGVKVQVFHGLAGEKKGHFRIRHYFDLYLTQGPYFTEWFQQAAHKHNDFEVKETGWCKLDLLFQHQTTLLEEKKKLLQQVGKRTLVLYAPTFSPSLTSAIVKKDEIFALADREDIFLQIKFHDLMNAEVINHYRQLAESRSNVQIIDDRNILKYLVMADVMISDTSSVVYEFILLDKPVITIDSTSKNISWKNITKEESLHLAFVHELGEDPFKNSRRNIIQQYHPYTDGKSSARMIGAVEDYINRNGVPAKRKLNFWRRYKMNKMFGTNPEQH
jgi:CDP-ribitol ribitolphosphotransferase / teichoic acid ribitol-phosphate polymerase